MKESDDARVTENKDLLDYLRYNSYFSQSKDLLYISTPKVACTSLKWWFAALEELTPLLEEVTDSIESAPELIIHDSFHKIAPEHTHLSNEVLCSALESESCFRFAVVRNPYKRIFSAWQSKLLLQEPYQSKTYKDCDFFNQAIESNEDFALAFQAFLEHLYQNEAPEFWDPHWTPQVSLLRPDLINYTIIAKIEEPKHLSEALLKHLGEGAVDPFSSQHCNESLLPFLPELITERSAELIQTLYADDFSWFGYSREIPKTSKKFSAGQYEVVTKAISLIRARHQRLDERNSEISSLRQKILGQQDLISNLELENVNLQALNSLTSQQLQDKEKELEQAKQGLQAKEKELEQVKLGLQAKDNELGQIKNELITLYLSKSWKMTRPLRQAKRFFRLKK